MDDFNWQRIRRQTRKWFKQNGRTTLAWRDSRTAYRIWISEIMLQQTTVATVRSYFDRFISTFPTVQELAASEEQEVLRLWEGLGYYSRARNLRKAAQVVVNEWGGTFPETAAELQKLPGIGRYTAGAISSIAFEKRAPIVEANTLRLFSRLLGYEGDPRSKAGQNLLWEFAEQVLPRKDCGDFNLALMDLGSMVCVPKSPNCPECPLKQDCLAFAQGIQTEVPRKAVKPKITYTVDAAIAINQAGTFGLKQYLPKERWAGLWDFPRISLEPFFETHQVERFKGHLNIKDKTTINKVTRWLEIELESLFGLQVEIGACLTEIKHSVTRYRIQLLCFEASYRSANSTEPSKLEWVTPAAFDEFAFSTTGRQFSTLIQKQAHITE